MKIPKQVEQMDEESNKNLEDDAKKAVGTKVTPVAPEQPANGDAPTAENPSPEKAEPKPTNTPTDKGGKAGILKVLPTAENPDDLDALRLENQRMRSMMGRIGKEHKEQEETRKALEEVRSQMALKDAEIERLKQELASASKRGVKNDGALSDDMKRLLKSKLGDGYSDEELQNFADAIGALSDLRTANLRNEIEAQRTNAAKTRADAFKARLEDEFPGFLKMDAEDNPKWVQFLETSLGGVMSDTTYGDIARIAAQRLDYAKFASVVRAFAEASGYVFSRGEQIDPSVAAQMRPRTVGVGKPTTTKAPQVFPRSEVNRFYRAYQARRAETTYGMTAEQVAERVRIYEDAEAEGRIDETR